MAWTQSAIATNDFSSNQGWGAPAFKRFLADLDQNGTADYIGFGFSGPVVGWGNQLRGPLGSQGPGFITRSESYDRVNNFGLSAGYNESYLRTVKDVGPFGAADNEVIAQANAGIIWYAATSETAIPPTTTPPSPNLNTYYIPNYSGPRLIQDFGHDQGWNSSHDIFFDKALNTDSSASVLGFGNFGLVVARSAFQNVASTTPTYTINVSVGNAAGWDNNRDVRLLEDNGHQRIDLNGDGILDFVGFGPNGAVFGYGFVDGQGRWQIPEPALANFGGHGADFGAAQGWNQTSTPRFLADVNHDGKPDVVAFGFDGVYVANGIGGSGQPFGVPYKAFANLGLQQGWGSNPDYIRALGDFNGDGFLDIIAFGATKTYLALNQTAAAGANAQFVSQATFENSSQQIQDLSVAQGWHTALNFRGVGDVNGDGKADVVASGSANTVVWSFS